MLSSQPGALWVDRSEQLVRHCPQRPAPGGVNAGSGGRGGGGRLASLRRGLGAKHGPRAAKLAAAHAPRDAARTPGAAKTDGVVAEALLGKVRAQQAEEARRPRNGRKRSARSGASAVAAPAGAAEGASAEPRQGQGQGHSVKAVSRIHGFLSDQDTHSLTRSTNYNQRELYTLFNRFKALCALSSTPVGIDKETFRRGVPMLSVEDAMFVDRVFEVLDEDGSGIIDWEEFIEAMSSLEKGSREKRTEFLFRVYDIDKDGGITKDELCQFFMSSLMVEEDDYIRELSEYFVDQVFHEVDSNQDGSMTVEEAMDFIHKHPEVTDIYGMFGRSMTSQQMDSFGGGGDFLEQGPRRNRQGAARGTMLQGARLVRRNTRKFG